MSGLRQIRTKRRAQILLDAVGTLSARASVSQAASAIFAGNANISAATKLNQSIVARLAGIGSLSVAYQAAANTISARFAGSGTLAPQVYLSLRAAVTWAEIEFTAAAAQSIEVQFSGAGNFSARSGLKNIAAVSFAGNGNLNTAAKVNASSAARFIGSGGLSATWQVAANQIQATFAGAGKLHPPMQPSVILTTPRHIWWFG